MFFNSAAGALRAGKTVNVYDGRVRWYDNVNAQAAGSVVNVGHGASALPFWDVATVSGTINVLNDEIGPGLFVSNNSARALAFKNAGGVLTFQDGSLISLAGTQVMSDLYNSFTNFTYNVNYVAYNGTVALTTAVPTTTSPAVLIGQNRRIVASYNNDPTFSGGTGFGWAPAVPALGVAAATTIIVDTPNGRNFNIVDAITVPDTKVMQVGEAQPYLTPASNGAWTRDLVQQDGNTLFSTLTVSTLGTINLVNGTLTLVNNAAGSHVINGTIDNSIVKPANFAGGGPLIYISAGRDWYPGSAGVNHRVLGTGLVKLGQGEDVQLVVDERNATALGTTNLAAVNTFPVQVEILGGASQVQQGTTPMTYTGQLRQIVGTDSGAINYAVGRFSSVKLDAASILAMNATTGANGNDAVVADVVLAGNARVISLNGTANAVSVGSIGYSGADTGLRTLTIGNGTGAGDNQMDLVGPMSGNVALVINSSATVRLGGRSSETISIDPSTYSLSGVNNIEGAGVVFSLGGKTLTMNMNATATTMEVWSQVGAGTINANVGTMVPSPNYSVLGGVLLNAGVNLNGATVNLRSATSDTAFGGNFVVNTGASTISVASSAAATNCTMDIGTLTFNDATLNETVANGYILRATGVTIAGTGSAVMSNAGGVTFAGITGAGTLTKTGAGNLTLNPGSILGTGFTGNIIATPSAAASIFGNVDIPSGGIRLDTNATLDISLAARQIGRLVFNGGAFTPGGNTLTINGFLGGVNNTTVSTANLSKMALANGAGIAPGTGLTPGAGAVAGITLGDSVANPVNFIKSTTQNFNYYWKFGSNTSYDTVAVNNATGTSATGFGFNNPTLKVYALPTATNNPSAQIFTVLTWSGPDPTDAPPGPWTPARPSCRPFIGMALSPPAIGVTTRPTGIRTASLAELSPTSASATASTAGRSSSAIWLRRPCSLPSSPAPRRWLSHRRPTSWSPVPPAPPPFLL